MQKVHDGLWRVTPGEQITVFVEAHGIGCDTAFVLDGNPPLAVASPSDTYTFRVTKGALGTHFTRLIVKFPPGELTNDEHYVVWVRGTHPPDTGPTRGHTF